MFLRIFIKCFWIVLVLWHDRGEQWTPISYIISSNLLSFFTPFPVCSVDMVGSAPLAFESCEDGIR